MSYIKRLIKKIKAIQTTYKIKIENPGINRTVKFKEPNNIRIGKNCSIGENSYLLCWNEYVYDEINQKLKGSILIGDNFSATRNLTIQSCNKVFIGKDVLIASNVFICDYNHGIDNVEGSYSNNSLTLSEVFIDDGVWVGQGVYILPGVHIGKNSIIGAGSVVNKDIPDLCIAVGNPAKVIKRYDNESNKWIKK